MTVLVVAFVGGAGAVSRYLVSAAAQRRTGIGFPVGTFVVNVSGAFLLGLAYGAGVDRTVPAAFLSGYTTFSTWVAESTTAPTRRGVANVALTLAVGLAAAYVGRWLGSIG